MKNLAEVMVNSNLVITNAQSVKELREALEPYGYDNERFAEGEKLYETFMALNTKQQFLYSDQFKATILLNKAREKAQKIYGAHVKLARIALYNKPDIAESLLLNGRRSKKLADWVQQAKTFYNNAIDLNLPEFKRRGMPQEVLEDGKEMVAGVSQLHYNQLRKKSLAQQTTRARNEALKELQRYVSELKAIARIALPKSQSLESIGIVVKR
jgi:hypothetical protein